MTRDYVQPQWVFDSANYRVLMPTDLYAATKELPPHLSPFAGANGAEDDGYEPEFLATIRKLQEVAKAARMEAAGILLADAGGEDESDFAGEGGKKVVQGGDAEKTEEQLAKARKTQEKQYAVELAKEMREGRKRRHDEVDGDEEKEEEEEKKEDTMMKKARE
mmetsp:Transcript_6646/g.12981  ORF Transcript_6646/g.12981 Transcript_6646/m.12981 type:complete len:163 (-) Transcript_6646:154-642(-)